MIPAWQHKLQAVLASWRGTPWIAGQQLRGPRGGVDCVRFVVGVLDELHGATLPPIPRLPQDMSLHNRDGAMRVARAIEERYAHDLIEPGSRRIEPGDVVIMRAGKNGGPGHVCIAGIPVEALWHAAQGVGVTTTSLAALGSVASPVRIWRPKLREAWR